MALPSTTTSGRSPRRFVLALEAVERGRTRKPHEATASYAVNRHVDFTPYRTSFELAECEVGEEHWSRRRESTAA